jgi:CO/xanthine dehydrogenase Mo-binding subunit
VLDREFQTQSVDPLFLEPECGLAWYDAARKNLELVLGVQSPYEAAAAIAFLLGEAQAPFKPSAINAQFAYIGGGFGGRDHTPFPLYVALAAMFFPSRPVRLAHDRYQQFQGGIKRHAFKMRTQIGVDRASGKMIAFAADHVLDGGGLANYSPSVAVTGATGAIGIYDIPKVDVTTVALHSRGVTAGSMRGYGTLQTMTALEVLIDEAAASLPLDPIEFRRRNALKTGGRTMTGNPYAVSIRTPEILDKLEKHPIWQHRAEAKARGHSGIVIGTGVAYSTKDYGTGADCSVGTVEIDPNGRITIHADAVEMGNGIGTAIANRVALHLGGVGDQVTLAQVDVFDALALVNTGNSFAMAQPEQDAGQQDPRWVPAVSSATSASIGAHVGTQAAAEEARIGFRFGLWPAALELWHIAPTDPRSNGRTRAGKTGNSSCRSCHHWRCRRSLQERTPAMLPFLRNVRHHYPKCVTLPSRALREGDALLTARAAKSQDRFEIPSRQFTDPRIRSIGNPIESAAAMNMPFDTYSRLPRVARNQLSARCFQP